MRLDRETEMKMDVVILFFVFILVLVYLFLRLIKFYLWTGCRRIEAIELTWKDIDQQNEMLFLEM